MIRSRSSSSRRSTAPGTVCAVPMFRSARVKLVTAYTIGIPLIMALFLVALYLALQQALMGNLEVEGSATAQLEHAILATELTRVRLALLAVNLAGWAISALVSYLVAARTLRSIEAALCRPRLSRAPHPARGHQGRDRRHAGASTERCRVSGNPPDTSPMGRSSSSMRSVGTPRIVTPSHHR